MNIDIQDIIGIVKQGAEIATARNFSISQKAGVENIVTSTDIAVQEFLCNKFLELIPESGFICEEGDLNNQSSAEYVWVIDPIDGTTNYARGISEYCISVALMYRREVIMGVVYNPVKKELFHATKGNGAYLNGKAISVSNRTFDNGILCTAMSLYRKEHAKVCSDIILDTYLKCNDVRRFGACALELCYLASGLCDLYFEYRVMPWDYAAGHLILKEAGGTISGYNHEALKLDLPTLLIGANSAANHSKLVEIINSHIDPKTCNYDWREW